MSIRRTVLEWGSREGERLSPWPCDDRAMPDEVSNFRAVDVAAEPNHVFRWLCQLRVAPYSYDWIDNLGRRSPRTLTPGLDDLATGQRFMVMFRLVEYERDRFVVLETSPSRWLGRVIVTYQTLASNVGGTRLVARLRVAYPGPPFGWLARLVLPVGDWIMMRKQLLTLKALAERHASLVQG